MEDWKEEVLGGIYDLALSKDSETHPSPSPKQSIYKPTYEYIFNIPASAIWTNMVDRCTLWTLRRDGGAGRTRRRSWKLNRRMS